MTKAKAITNEIVSNSSTQRFLFKFLLGSLVALFIVYIYMIGSITFNVVARKSLENTARLLSSNINQLELAYINSVNDIDKQKAESLGFVDSKANIFAVRNINQVAVR